MRPLRAPGSSSARRCGGVNTPTTTVASVTPRIAARIPLCSTLPRQTTQQPTAAATRASTTKVRTRPMPGTSTKPVSMTPMMPPTVFKATTAPTSRPTCVLSTLKRKANGKAAPRTVVGRNTTHSAAVAKRAHIPASSLPVRCSTSASTSVWAMISQRPSPAICTSASKPASAINRPNRPQGSRIRSARRA
ncbi:hypothetical protein D3C80_713960 [compost metagenome]